MPQILCSFQPHVEVTPESGKEIRSADQWTTLLRKCCVTSGVNWIVIKHKPRQVSESPTFHIQVDHISDSILLFWPCTVEIVLNIFAWQISLIFQSDSLSYLCHSNLSYFLSDYLSSFPFKSLLFLSYLWHSILSSFLKLSKNVVQNTVDMWTWNRADLLNFTADFSNWKLIEVYYWYNFS